MTNQSKPLAFTRSIALTFIKSELGAALLWLQDVGCLLLVAFWIVLLAASMLLLTVVFVIAATLLNVLLPEQRP